MLFLQSPLDLLQRVSLRQARQDPRTSKGLVSKEGLVRSDGLAEVGDGVLLRLELGKMMNYGLSVLGRADCYEKHGEELDLKLTLLKHLGSRVERQVPYPIK